MPITKVAFYRSPKKDKRLQAIFYDDNNKRVKTTHFGLKNPKIGTYIDHHNKEIREKYIKRHKVNEDWTDPTKAGTLSRFILWGDKTNILDAIKAFRRKFNLKAMN